MHNLREVSSGAAYLRTPKMCYLNTNTADLYLRTITSGYRQVDSDLESSDKCGKYFNNYNVSFVSEIMIM